MDITQEMLTTINDDRQFLKEVITDDESWVYGCDIEIKVLSSIFATIDEIKVKLIQKLLAIQKSAV